MLSQKRGRLKIYFGFVPGVGKTYKMLQEALYLQKQHYSVVIGWLEESNRQETMDLVRNFEVIPAKKIIYKEKDFKEMNTEAIAQKSPYLVIIDELAHTNLPGGIHSNRYEDIEYLLNKGINVMTTLNIQHVEGVKDEAANIMGTQVSEFVPDWILDKADEVELIDTSPRVIQERLREGKIFPKESINKITASLFSANKLLGLRELALRYVAKEVDERLENYKERKGIFNQAQVHERVLVCVNAPATAKHLITTGAKMAKRMMCEFIVLYIGVDSNLVDKEEEFVYVNDQDISELTLIFNNLTCENNGKFIVAKVPSKANISDGITRVIKEKKITQVVIGESGISRWKEILKGSIITKILSKVRNVDVFVAGSRENRQSNIREIKAGYTKDVTRGKVGNFKIYIGASAGVGKTVAMLKEAKDLKNKGTDVVIGIIETHNRKETIEHLIDFETIEQKTIDYRGVPMKDLDVQAIINRKPQVVLIDELAHTNVPGSKNEKRYQDVIEIIKSGINVISAVNIQHIESLNDIVEDVTGVKIKETVPDAVIARADELVMIDVTPETLRDRLKSGKIYANEKIEQALNSFFRKENLQALRELALLEVAHDVEGDKKVKINPKENKDNVLVCIQVKDDHDRLIRKGFKIAQRLKAGFKVLHINDGKNYTMEESQTLDILKGLAERLGGKFYLERVTSKRQLILTILYLINKKQITKLVLGQSARTRWDEIINGSIINAILSESKGTDIYIIAASKKNISR